MSALKLVSLNVEHSRHIERFLPFLKKEKPDVVCLQELCETDIPVVQKMLGFASHEYAGMTRVLDDAGVRVTSGLGIFSRFPIRAVRREYYCGTSGPVPDFDRTDVHTKHATEHHMVLACDIVQEVSFRIATTHFIWTPRGGADEYQREGVVKLLGILEKLGSFVLCGDFNAPRMHEGKPGEIFSLIASRYTDNIPSRYATSVDASLHRNGAVHPDHFVDKMVDGLFTTPVYRASNVRLVDGVSDHMAIVADIERV